MATLEIMNPVAETRQSRTAAAPRLGTLDGKTIGLFWNMKAGGDIALDAIAEELGKRYSGMSFRHYVGAVGNLVRQATPEQVEQIRAECDAVIGTSSD